MFDLKKLILKVKFLQNLAKKFRLFPYSCIIACSKYFALSRINFVHVTPIKYVSNLSNVKH